MEAIADCNVGLRSFFFQPAGVSQRSPATAQSNVMAEQKALQQKARDADARRQQLQAQAKKLLADEMAQENAGDCKDAKTTVDFNECFGKQVEITDKNLKAFEDVIAELGDPEPDAPDHPAGTGIAGPTLSPKQHVAEFRKVEQSWRQYRDAAYTTAFHRFDGGTGGPSFELECELKLDRSHMHELDMIYGEDLHL